MSKPGKHRARATLQFTSVAFDKASDWTVRASGTAVAFALAVTVVLTWLAVGPFVGFGNALYQLAINTGTTIVTFLMVFLLQNAANRAATRDRARAKHDAAQAARLERMEREHGEMLKALHVMQTEQTAMLRTLHAHVTAERPTMLDLPAVPSEPEHAS